MTEADRLEAALVGLLANLGFPTSDISELRQANADEIATFVSTVAGILLGDSCDCADCQPDNSHPGSQALH